MPPLPAKPWPTLGNRSARLYDAIVGSAVAYCRERDLPRVLPVGPSDVADVSPAGRRRILSRLASALRAERRLGRAGHWTYDLNRHIALAQVYESERRLLCGKPPSVNS